MQLAQNFNSISSGAGLNSTSDTSISSLIARILPYAFYGAAILLLIYMILGGFQIMTSRSDPKATAMGWGKISSALIGFFLVILAYTITGLVGEILGIEIFKSLFGGGFGSVGGGLKR